MKARPGRISPAAHSVEWMDSAQCRDTRLDFTDDNFGVQQAAKLVCWRDCPVRAECLTYALARNETGGVWGGYTPEERTAIPRRRRLRGVGL